MLKELFEGHFYGTFHQLGERVLLLDEKTEKGDFSLLDDKSCRDCHYICEENITSREQLRVSAEQTVNVISIDQVFSYVEEDLGERCDYMFDNHQAIVLVEMTCSSSGYVKDKRQKAKRQLYNTLCVLFTSPLVKEHIEKHVIRYVVFSWKETFAPDLEEDIVERNMADMTIMTDVIYSPDNELKFDFGFKLREIRYPDALVL